LQEIRLAHLSEEILAALDIADVIPLIGENFPEDVERDEI